MNLSTILTLPAATNAEKARRIGELITIKVAARLPQRLRYAVLISCGVRAIRGNEVVPNLAYMDVLQRTPKR